MLLLRKNTDEISCKFTQECTNIISDVIKVQEEAGSKSFAA